MFLESSAKVFKNTDIQTSTLAMAFNPKGRGANECLAPQKHRTSCSRGFSPCKLKIYCYCSLFQIEHFKCASGGSTFGQSCRNLNNGQRLQQPRVNLRCTLGLADTRKSYSGFPHIPHTVLSKPSPVSESRTSIADINNCSELIYGDSQPFKIKALIRVSNRRFALEQNSLLERE